jgi:superfamily II DNA helicase RecQ
MEVSTAGRNAVAILPTGYGARRRDARDFSAHRVDEVPGRCVGRQWCGGHFLKSSILGSEAQRRHSGLEQDHYKLLYAAVEHVMMAGFIQDLQR